jgi:eukaryotic-like serine/threonine-protein kinase
MPAKVTLTVTDGKLRGQQFVFADRTTCIVGRADGCEPRLPDDKEHKTISRHHCLLDINPPDLRVRDFGSLNGTYVNGAKIGQRQRDQTPEQAAQMHFPEHDLKDGDKIELGQTVLQVGVFVPVRCPLCWTEIADAELPQFHKARCCQACLKKAAAQAPARVRVCARCGKQADAEMGANRGGELVCATCRQDPLKIVQDLLAQAQAGQADVRPLAGHRLVGRLGQGGTGAAFLLQHERSGEHVAVTILLPRIAVEPRARDMFLHEAGNIASLRHANVVRLIDFGCAQGTVFFCMQEYCDGGSVEQLLKQRGGPLPPAEACDIVLEALDGLGHAHHVPLPAPGSRGLVHRDLGPHNLLLAGTGAARRAKIGDYGLAKAFDAAGLSGLTSTGLTAGKPRFVPRQQVVNFKYAGPELDVWAMAATLYHMLTGQFPRNFPEGKDPWRTVLETDALPIRRRQPDLPASLAEVIDRALVDKPDIPFKSAAQFKAALERVVPRQQSVIPVVSPVEEAPVPAKALSVGEQSFSSPLVVHRYPAPIAIPYRRFLRHADEPRLRLDALFHAVEGALRYLVTLGLSDLLHCLAVGGRSEIPDLPAFEFLRRPRPLLLGKWCEALRETARLLAGEDQRVLEEFPAVCEPGGRLDKLWGWLVTRRNQGAHRDGARVLGADECWRMLSEVRPRLEDALQEIAFVRRYPLGFARPGLGAAAAAGPRRYTLHSCMGARVADARQAEVIETAATLPLDAPFVVAADGQRVLPLWPFLLERVSPLTGRPTLYCFEELGKNFMTEVRAAALDAVEDWALVLHERSMAHHGWLLERLRATPPLTEVPVEGGLASRLQPLATGELVGHRLGPNQLRAVLASGGLGTIYSADHRELGPVAVKVIEFSPTPEEATRFLREFKKLQKACQHPGIIRCHEGGVSVVRGQEYPWYAMELAGGGSLRQRLEDRRTALQGRLPWDDPPMRAQVRAEFQAIASAAAHLHRLNLIHRDIKPRNILVTTGGELRLADFGLVKDLVPSDASLGVGRATSIGALLGTRRYLAPEQAGGKEIDKHVDVYALGVLLVELATGVQPEPDVQVTQGSTLHQCQVLQKLPRELRKFIWKCTDADPSKRFVDGDGVLAEFLRLE